MAKRHQDELDAETDPVKREQLQKKHEQERKELDAKHAKEKDELTKKRSAADEEGQQGNTSGLGDAATMGAMGMSMLPQGRGSNISLSGLGSGAAELGSGVGGIFSEGLGAAGLAGSTILGSGTSGNGSSFGGISLGSSSGNSGDGSENNGEDGNGTADGTSTDGTSTDGTNAVKTKSDDSVIISEDGTKSMLITPGEPIELLDYRLYKGPKEPFTYDIPFTQEEKAGKIRYKAYFNTSSSYGIRFYIIYSDYGESVQDLITYIEKFVNRFMRDNSPFQPFLQSINRKITKIERQILNNEIMYKTLFNKFDEVADINSKSTYQNYLIFLDKQKIELVKELDRLKDILKNMAVD